MNEASNNLPAENPTPERERVEARSPESGVEAPEVAPAVEGDVPAPVEAPTEAQMAAAAEAAPVPAAPQVEAALPPRDPVLMSVEAALVGKEPDLWREYLSMSADARQRLKDGGEALAAQLSVLSGTNPAPTDVHEHITTWLRSIPGVVDPYVLKAAKIMTDRVLKVVGEPHDDTAL